MPRRKRHSGRDSEPDIKVTVMGSGRGPLEVERRIVYV